MKVSVLKVQRVVRGLTQTEVGEKLGVSQTYITMLESMRTRPSKKVSEKLEDLFDMELDDLLCVAKVGERH